MSNYLTDGYYGDVAASAPVNERVAFIRKTYLTLSFSMMALVGVEALLIKSGLGKELFVTLFRNPIMLLITLVLFIGAGFVARIMARGDMPTPVKYLGLGLYICLEAIFLLPILLYAEARMKTELIGQAAVITMAVFGGLSVMVFVSKKDFSFMGGILSVLSLVALGVVLAAIVLPLFGFAGFTLGIWFSAAMVALAAGYIVYDTSNIIHHYSTKEHVGAALELLANVVMLFYYILRILLWRDEN